MCPAQSSCLCRLLRGELLETLYPYPSPSLTSDSSSCELSSSSGSIFSMPQSLESHARKGQDLVVLDLRPSYDFETSHLRHSHNFPLPITEDDFFGDAKAVQQRWMQLNTLFDGEAWIWTTKREVLVLCADGDSSRMATAILRAKENDAYCVEGGFPALHSHLRRSPGRVSEGVC